MTDLERLVAERTAELLAINEQLKAQIRKKRKREKALRESEKRLHQAQRLASLGHWDWIVATDELHWSAEVYRILGQDPAVFAPSVQAFETTIHPDDRARFFAERDQSLAKDEPINIDHRIVRPDGTIRHVQELAEVIRDDNGRIVKVMGTVQDITERKQADALLRLQALVLDQIQDCVTVTDLAGNITYVNEAESRLTGRPRDALIGDHVRSYGEDPTKGATQEQILRHTLEHGAWRGEVINQTADGCRVLLDCRTQLVKDERGRPIAMCGISTDVTRRRKTEEQLRHNENLLSRIFDILPIGLWFADKNGKLLRGNPAGIRIWGAEPRVGLEEYGVFKARRLPSGKPIATDDWALARTVREGVTITDELLEIDAFDGQTKTILNSTAPVLDDQGQVEGAVVVNLDITALRKTQEALAESERRLRTVFGTVPMGYQSLDEKGCFIEVNKAWLEILGYTRDEVIGRSFADFLHPQWREHFKINFPRFKAIGEILGVEFEMVKKDGTLVTVAFDGRIGRDPAGGFQQTHCVMTDITARRRAEKELRDAHERLLTILDAIENHIYVADMQRHEILFMNRCMRESFGADFTGRLCWQVLRNESGPCCCCTNDKLLDAAGQPAGLVAWEAQNPVTGRWYLNHDQAIAWVDGRIVRLQVATDITERKEMENQRLEIENRLRQSQKMEAIGALAGGIAHDFNNILFPIIGFAEILIDDIPAGSQARDHARGILKAAQRARELVQQILAFSRQTDQQVKPLKVQTILKEVLALTRSTLPATIEIRTAINPDCGAVMADAIQIHQLVMNLITNAFHAMEQTGGRLDIQLDRVVTAPGELKDPSMAPGPYACLTVADSGCGMDPQTLGRIFDPYFTTKAMGKGTGLGLAVVHGVVKSHGGEITVESQTGQGTVFKVYLPLLPSEGPAPERGEDRSVPLGSEQILLVDDEEAIVKMEKVLLERLGYQVSAYSGSIEALAAFTAAPHRYDLVITDMTMSRMTGVELARQLKALRPEIRVILCTGFSEQIDAARAKALGIEGFVLKPILKKEIAALIREVLD